MDQADFEPDQYLAFARALAAAARAFADELDRRYPSAATPVTSSAAGSEPELPAYYRVLRDVARINNQHSRGATDAQIRAIAHSVGYDPRGLAAYYRYGLLEKRTDGSRWITDKGRAALAAAGVVV